MKEESQQEGEARSVSHLQASFSLTAEEAMGTWNEYNLTWSEYSGFQPRMKSYGKPQNLILRDFDSIGLGSGVALGLRAR